MQKLKKYGSAKSWRCGGVEHLYWVKEVEKKLIHVGYHQEEKYPIGSGETADLAMQGRIKNSC